MLVCHACGAVNRTAFGRDLTNGTCGKCHQSLATPSPVDIDAAMLSKLQRRDTGAFVLDIWAPWCGPCRMMAPAYQEAAATLASRVRLFKLDSDKNQSASAALGVRGIPTLVAYANGTKVAHQAGALAGDALTHWILSTFNMTGDFA